MSIISPTCLHSITQYAVEYGTVRYCDRYSMFAPQPQIYTLLILGSIEFKGQGEGLALAFLFTQAVDRCVFYSMSHCNVHWKPRFKFADCTASSWDRGESVSAASLWWSLVQRLLLAICCFPPELGYYTLKYAAALFCHKPWAFRGTASCFICIWHSLSVWALLPLCFHCDSSTDFSNFKRSGGFQRRWSRIKVSTHAACLVQVGACTSVAVVRCIIAGTHLHQKQDKNYDRSCILLSLAALFRIAFLITIVDLHIHRPQRVFAFCKACAVSHESVAH